LATWSAGLPARGRVIGGLTQGLMSATAAIVAYLPTKPLGLQEGFWASITAIAVVQTEWGAARTSARDQFTGAAIGGSISALTVTATGQHLWSYAVAVVVSMLACFVFKVAGAARLSGSTATIILLVPHPGSVESMVASRIAEVAWGVVVAITTVWLVNRFEKLATEPPAQRR
jgi:uncharacterized membrane protein YgaE (UPF0421/DUF939 family)